MMQERSSRGAVLLMTSEQQTARAVESTLNSEESPFSLVGLCRDLPELSERLEAGAVQAALVDIDSEPERTLRDLGPIVARMGEVRFIILSNALRSDLMLQAMTIGARHFLLKMGIAGELVGVLQRLVSTGPVMDSKHGTLVTVLSGSGGCGATTLAVNLANELRLETSQPVLLVDLDSAYGAVGTWLGLRGSCGIADVLNHANGIDAHLIRSCSRSYGQDLHALLSPASVNVPDPPALKYQRLGDALAAFKVNYQYTVVDAPRLPVGIVKKLVMASQLTLLVLQLTVKDIRVVQNLMSPLLQQGVKPEQLMLVVNRYHKRNLITLEEARQALNGAPLVCVSNDFQSATRAINLGQPLAEVAKASPLRQDLRQLALNVIRGRG